MSALEQLLAFWRIVEKRGDKPKPAFAVMWTVTNEFVTAGGIATWSLDRNEATEYAKQCGEKLCRVVRMTPES